MVVVEGNRKAMSTQSVSGDNWYVASTVLIFLVYHLNHSLDQERLQDAKEVEYKQICGYSPTTVRRKEGESKEEESRIERVDLIAWSEAIHRDHPVSVRCACEAHFEGQRAQS